MHKRSLRIACSHTHFRQRTQLRVRTEYQIGHATSPFQLAGLPGHSPFSTPSAAADFCHLRAHIEQVDEEVIAQGLWAPGEHAMPGFPNDGIQGRAGRPPTQSSPAQSGSAVAPCRSTVQPGIACVGFADVVTEAVCDGFEHGE